MHNVRLLPVHICVLFPPSNILLLCLCKRGDGCGRSPVGCGSQLGLPVPSHSQRPEPPEWPHESFQPPGWLCACAFIQPLGSIVNSPPAAPGPFILWASRELSPAAHHPCYDASFPHPVAAEAGLVSPTITCVGGAPFPFAALHTGRASSPGYTVLPPGKNGSHSWTGASYTRRHRQAVMPPAPGGRGTAARRQCLTSPCVRWRDGPGDPG